MEEATAFAASLCCLLWLSLDRALKEVILVFLVLLFVLDNGVILILRISLPLGLDPIILAVLGLVSSPCTRIALVSVLHATLLIEVLLAILTFSDDMNFL